MGMYKTVLRLKVNTDRMYQILIGRMADSMKVQSHARTVFISQKQ